MKKLAAVLLVLSAVFAVGVLADAVVTQFPTSTLTEATDGNVKRFYYENKGFKVFPAGSTLLNGLVSYWDLDETSGTRADSVIASGNDLTDNNTVLYDTGVNSNAASFVAGNAEYLSITDASQTGLDVGAAGTWSFWMKRAATTENQVLFSKWTYSSDGGIIVQTAADGADFSIYVATSQTDNGSGCRMDFNDANQSADTWYHIMVVFDRAGADDAARLKVYQNNTALTLTVGSGAVPNTILANAAPFLIGTELGLGRVYGGLIDEFAIWSRVLTADERTELYNSGSGKFYPFE